jgi:hypothetical protein
LRSLTQGERRARVGMSERAFKGVWICAAIWTHPDLSWVEKALLAEIDSLVSDEAPCYASNEHLASRVNVSVSRVNDMLAHLQKAGFLVRVQYDGRTTHRVVGPDYSSNPETAKRWGNRIGKHAGLPKAGSRSSQKQEIRFPKKRKPEFPKTGDQTLRTQEAGVPENKNRYIERISEESTIGENPLTTTKSNSEAVGTADGSSSFSLAHELAEEYGLSKKQRQIVSEYCESLGEAYVRGKAKIVRAQPCRNAAGALLAALRDDWQPPVQPNNKAPDKQTPLDAPEALARTRGWTW